MWSWKGLDSNTGLNNIPRPDADASFSEEALTKPGSASSPLLSEEATTLWPLLWPPSRVTVRPQKAITCERRPGPGGFPGIPHEIGLHRDGTAGPCTVPGGHGASPLADIPHCV